MVQAAGIETAGIGKDFGSFTALDDVSLRIAQGEFLTLLGPSGSGKTTFLMILAGFERASRGRLLLNGIDMTNTSVEDRGFGMVFQGYALFPHMTAAENIAFPLKVQKRSAKDIKRRVDEMIEMVGLGGHGHKKPSGLSGGQQQRVALARALSYEPPVLLLDEPLSALDKNLRNQMQDELRRIHNEIGTTFVFVTHDQTEALALSTHIAIFDHGRLQQLGSPSDVYERPANRFVAEFLGEINILPLSRNGNDSAIEGHPVVLPANTDPNCDHIAIRPEHLVLSLQQNDRLNSIKSTVSELVYLGGETRLLLETAAGIQMALDIPTAEVPAAIAKGQEVWTSWDPERGLLV